MNAEVSRAISMNLLQATLVALGYDGAIDTAPIKKFAKAGFVGMDKKTLHYALFDAAQVEILSRTPATDSPSALQNPLEASQKAAPIEDDVSESGPNYLSPRGS